MTRARYYDYSRHITQNKPTKIITKKELALILGKSESTVSRMVRDGRLPKPLLTPTGQNGGWFTATISNWIESKHSR